jgi:hypothetical protein
MRLGLTIIVTFLWTLTSYCQSTLNKKEILNEIRTNRTVPKLDSIFYDGYHSGARADLDKLLTKDIDTLFVFSFSFPGHTAPSRKDSCSTQLHNSYFFWKEQGKYFFKATFDNCISTDKFSSSKIINYMTDNFSRIKDEFFMEAVFGAERKGDKIRLSQSWVDHEGKYSILVLVNGQYNYLEFTDNGLTNKKSLFLDHNKALTSFGLFELIKGEVKTGG